jgi:hypothetical protein
MATSAHASAIGGGGYPRACEDSDIFLKIALRFPALRHDRGVAVDLKRKELGHADPADTVSMPVRTVKPGGREGIRRP